jgi:hypothetical protein
MYVPRHSPTNPNPKPTASEIASTLTENLAGDPVVSTAGVIGGALRELLRAIAVRNAAVRQAHADATRAGLVDAKSDPLSRVVVGHEPVAPSTRTRQYVDCDGRRHVEASSTDAVLSVVNAALTAAGVNARAARIGK